MDEQKNKGGKIPEKASKYYSSPSRRSPDVQELKRLFGSVGVDCFVCAQERIAQSDFFLFELSNKNLRRIQDEDLINPEDFIKVIKYAALDLEYFDPVLFENNMLFSLQFVRNFDKAGLFRQRRYNAESVLNTANYYRPGHLPLTLEDKLELIAQGKYPAPNNLNNNPAHDNDNSTPPQKGNNKGDNTTLLGDNELPF